MINDQEVIRAMCPRNCTVKWLARLAGISLRAARLWTERTVPIYRRADLGLLMIEEYHRQSQWREEVLYPALCKMAGLANEVEIFPATSSIADSAADLVGAAADRVEAAIDWLETG